LSKHTRSMNRYRPSHRFLCRIAGSLCALLISSAVAQAGNVSLRCAGSTIILLDSASAAPVSGKPDVYSREHTDFDRAIRLGKPGATEQEYLKAAAKDVQNWTLDEQTALKTYFATIDSVVSANKYHINLPDTIKVIKTTAREEFGAEGYTRENRIMLNVGAQPLSVGLVAHELFHVISRYNPQLRDRIYGVFHFKPCNNIVYKPALGNKVITNPDCPFVAHYLTLNIKGEQKDVALIMYSPNDYHEGYTMDRYVAIGLLGLTGDDQHKAPLIEDGKPVIYNIETVPDFQAQVGSNTPYILHIEEISAEHFAGLMSGSAQRMQQQTYVTGVRQALLQ